MNELATIATDWYVEDWSYSDEDPRDRLYEYIVSPEPLSDSCFDEGEGD